MPLFPAVLSGKKSGLPNYEGYCYLASCASWDFPRIGTCQVLAEPVFIGDKLPSTLDVQKSKGQEELSVKFFPNPSSEVLHLNTELSIISLSLFSVEGQLVKRNFYQKKWRYPD